MLHMFRFMFGPAPTTQESKYTNKDAEEYIKDSNYTWSEKEQIVTKKPSENLKEKLAKMQKLLRDSDFVKVLFQYIDQNLTNIIDAKDEGLIEAAKLAIGKYFDDSSLENLRSKIEIKILLVWLYQGKEADWEDQYWSRSQELKSKLADFIIKLPANEDEQAIELLQAIHGESKKWNAQPGSRSIQTLFEVNKKYDYPGIFGIKKGFNSAELHKNLSENLSIRQARLLKKQVATSEPKEEIETPELDSSRLHQSSRRHG